MNITIKADSEVIRFLNNIGESVEKLPAWKRGVLESSSRSSNPEPRRPVAVPEMTEAFERARQVLIASKSDTTQLGLNRYRLNENKPTIPINLGK